MANDGTGTGWDVASPADSDYVEFGAQEIRDVRKGVAIRLNKEHVTSATSSAGGEHKLGSGMMYVQATAPTLRPDGVTSLTSADKGRIWVDTDDKTVYYYTGSAWARIVSFSLLSGSIQTAYPYAVVDDAKADGTDGGDLTASTWNTRNLNEILFDTNSIVTSVSSNRFTLPAGTYRIRASAPAYEVNRHQIRIRNITDGTTAAYGTSEAASTADPVMTRSVACAEVVIGGSKAFEIQHNCSSTKTNTGAGIAGSFGGTEIYTQVEIWKLT